MNMERRRLTCKYCRQRLYVGTGAEYICCSGCKLVSPIDNNDVVHQSRMPPRTSDTNVIRYKGVPPSAQHINCLGWEIDYSDGNTRDDYVEKYRGTEDRSRRRKFFSSNIPPNAISMTDQPPRGRRALICGVSYKKQKHELKGTVQDVENMKELLVQEYNFPTESILILAEDGPYILPTRKNIEVAFQWLIRGIQPGDSLVFYFSGHGKLQQNLNWYDDGFDEAICPMDFETSGMIMKSYINEAIVRPLISGVILHAIIDSSHNGTILDLPYVYDITERKWEDNRPPSGAYKGASGGMAICFSACDDDQLAARTSAFSSGKEITGAMTTTFINAVRKSLLRNESISYQGIMDSIHHSIKQAGKSGGFFAGMRWNSHQRILQDPQISSTKVFDPNTEFRL